MSIAAIEPLMSVWGYAELELQNMGRVVWPKVQETIVVASNMLAQESLSTRESLDFFNDLLLYLMQYLRGECASDNAGSRL
ncbi:hypothetical protein cyc_09091 [Cyclospora cayetanensis]|uniref:Uncharacterized protein n=1 Tax=Cyclospora cayetanensis TaxID=88456 RepID=A0A1D3D1H2_9EIME|nr:hypothetical protein cyc_09091 [Cyclospora cayetanensis]